MNEIIYDAELRPKSSMTINGQQWFVSIVLALMIIKFCIFMISWRLVYSNPADMSLWSKLFLLSFFLVPVILIILALVYHNYKLRLRERITITTEKLTIERTEPNGHQKCFETNPYWVKIQLQDTPKLKSYLTLKDNFRHVELGSFLPSEHRRDLYRELISIQQSIRGSR